MKVIKQRRIHTSSCSWWRRLRCLRLVPVRSGKRLTWGGGDLRILAEISDSPSAANRRRWGRIRRWTCQGPSESSGPKVEEEFILIGVPVKHVFLISKPLKPGTSKAATNKWIHIEKLLRLNLKEFPGLPLGPTVQVKHCPIALYQSPSTSNVNLEKETFWLFTYWFRNTLLNLLKTDYLRHSKCYGTACQQIPHPASSLSICCNPWSPRKP